MTTFRVRSIAVGDARPVLTWHWVDINPPVLCGTLVDDEAVFGQVRSGDAAGVGAEQEEDFGRVLPDGVHSRFVTQVQRRHLAGHPARAHTDQSRSLERTEGPGRSKFTGLRRRPLPVQDVEDLPALLHAAAGAGVLRHGRDGAQDGGAVVPLQGSAAQHHHGPLGGRQDLAEGVRAVGQLPQHRRLLAKVLVRVAQVHLVANHGHLQLVVQPADGKKKRKGRMNK